MIFQIRWKDFYSQTFHQEFHPHPFFFGAVKGLLQGEQGEWVARPQKYWTPKNPLLNRLGSCVHPWTSSTLDVLWIFKSCIQMCSQEWEFKLFILRVKLRKQQIRDTDRTGKEWPLFIKFPMKTPYEYYLHSFRKNVVKSVDTKSTMWQALWQVFRDICKLLEKHFSH